MLENVINLFYRRTVPSSGEDYFLPFPREIFAPGAPCTKRKLRSRNAVSPRNFDTMHRSTLLPYIPRTCERQYCILPFRLRKHSLECTYIRCTYVHISTHSLIHTDRKTLYRFGSRADGKDEMCAVCFSHAECMNSKSVETAEYNSEKKIAAL